MPQTERIPRELRRLAQAGLVLIAGATMLGCSRDDDLAQAPVATPAARMSESSAGAATEAGRTNPAELQRGAPGVDAGVTPGANSGVYASASVPVEGAALTAGDADSTAERTGAAPAGDVAGPAPAVDRN